MWQKAFSKKNKTFFKEINWRNFVVYYNEGEIDVTSVVFFKDKLKDKQIRKYWHLFKVLEEKAVHKRESIPGWEEAEKKANSLNASLNARLEIKRRFGRIIDNPKRIFVKAINLKTWKYFFRDIEDMIRR